MLLLHDPRHTLPILLIILQLRLLQPPTFYGVIFTNSTYTMRPRPSWLTGFQRRLSLARWRLGQIAPQRKDGACNRAAGPHGPAGRCPVDDPVEATIPDVGATPQAAATGGSALACSPTEHAAASASSGIPPIEAAASADAEALAASTPLEVTVYVSPPPPTLLPLTVPPPPPLPRRYTAGSVGGLCRLCRISDEAWPELDLEEDMALRRVRHELLREQLLAGRPVCDRRSDWSMFPRIQSGDLTHYDPVTSADQVMVGDIVFYEVQPGNRFYAHLVKHKEWNSVEWIFTFSNAKGRGKGSGRLQHIYGRLVAVCCISHALRRHMPERLADI